MDGSSGQGVVDRELWTGSSEQRVLDRELWTKSSGQGVLDKELLDSELSDRELGQGASGSSIFFVLSGAVCSSSLTRSEHQF